MSLPLNKPIIQLTETPILQIPQNIVQPKITSKVPVPESSQIYDKFIPVPNYKIPQTGSGDDSKSRTIRRKSMQDMSRKNPAYTDPIYRPPS